MLARSSNLGGFVAAWAFTAALAGACPFCTTPHPSLAERREDAAVVALAESRGGHDYHVHRVLEGADRLGSTREVTIAAAAPLEPGTLALLFGQPDDVAHPATLAWKVVKVDETSLGYFVAAPDMRQPSAERLRYFVPFLEHANPQIAEDAYVEFGRAPFDAVETVAARLDMQKVAAWLRSDAVPQERKGLYGLMLGLAPDESGRRAQADVLRQVIEQPASDFRAGFDGVLGGYLLATGEPGLALIEQRLLANPDAPRGDVLHAMTALRFYQQYGHSISTERLSQALAHVLARPEFAAAAIVDLARWKAWDQRPRITAMFDDPAYADGPTDRAIVGYLLACPQPEAVVDLKHLRELAPDRVHRAEQAALAPARDR